MPENQVSTNDEFECWLATMDDFLDDFSRAIDDSERQRLDFSAASLDIAEAWIIRTYPNPQAMLKPREAARVNAVACYIGECFRKAFNGKWTIDLVNRDNVYFGVPVIVAPGKDPECPLSLATASADRRSGSFVRRVFEHY